MPAKLHCGIQAAQVDDLATNDLTPRLDFGKNPIRSGTNDLLPQTPLWRLTITNLEFQSPLIQKMVAFLIRIGIDIEAQAISEKTFVPGIKVGGGTLVVDEALLKYPGDLLHEAGHLAVIAPEARRAGAVGQKPHEEMMAIAWSYAAARQLGLDASIVVHEGGYQGWREKFINALNDGSFEGIALLQQIGLTVENSQAESQGVAPYPHMIKWLS